MISYRQVPKKGTGRKYVAHLEDLNVLLFFVSVPMSVDLRGTNMPSKVAVLDKIARKYLQSVLQTPWVKRGNSKKGDRLLYITL